MPNGFHGSKTEWERIEAPLASLDAHITGFARRHGMQIRKSDRNWPSRSLGWGSPVHRSIQLSLLDDKSLTFSMAVMAYQDRKGERFAKSEPIASELSVDDIRSQWEILFEKGRLKANAWGPADLEPSGVLKDSDTFVLAQRQDRILNVLLYGTLVTLVFFGALFAIWKVYS